MLLMVVGIIIHIPVEAGLVCFTDMVLKAVISFCSTLLYVQPALYAHKKDAIVINKMIQVFALLSRL